MLPELGVLFLGLALAASLLQARGGWADIALERQRFYAGLQLAGCLGAFGVLLWTFAASDFSVLIVAENSHTTKPLIYKLSGAWGNHEGSALMWALIHAFYAFLYANTAPHVSGATKQKASSIIGALNAPTLLFILAASNPFERLAPAALEGQGLNPLLQDPALAIHPPILYAGYVGFVVPFGIAAAAISSKSVNRSVASEVLPWGFSALALLTLGVGLGSWWAYRELGWGGWWFWDPVENASLLPWFSGLALTHAALVWSRQGRFGRLALATAFASFALSVFGAFLVRSGALTSVHAFAVDPQRGAAIFSYFVFLTVISTVLYLRWRKHNAGAGEPVAVLSKEAFIITGVSLSLVILGSILIAIIYPLFLGAFGLSEVSVGAPYFNRVVVPILFVFLMLLAVAPAAPWRRRASWRHLSRLRVPIICGAAGVVIAMAMGASVSSALAVGIGAAALIGVLASTNVISQPMLALRRFGLVFSHGGIALAAAGMIGSGFFSTEKIMPVKTGDEVAIAGVRLSFDGVERREAVNYFIDRGVLSKIANNGETTREWLTPERRWYPVADKTTSEAAIQRTLWADLYVTLGDLRAPGVATPDWALRLYHRPMVSWIWLGCVFAFLGMTVSAASVSGRRSALSDFEVQPSKKTVPVS